MLDHQHYIKHDPSLSPEEEQLDDFYYSDLYNHCIRREALEEDPEMKKK